MTEAQNPLTPAPVSLSVTTRDLPTPARALAIGAHPDDAEFLCAGTLARLRAEHGWAVHIASMTPGDCGSAEHTPDAIARRRRRMILPLRVFGSRGVTRTSAGRASFPISVATCSPSAPASAPASSAPWAGITKATIASPVRSSGRGTTAASTTWS